MVDKTRIRHLNAHRMERGSVVAYWMSRDQRVKDNWALLHAQEIAQNAQRPLVVLFVLTEGFPGATWRSYDFMIKGLQEIESRLYELNIPFILAVGNPSEEIPNMVKQYDISALVTDMSPLRIGKTWRADVARAIDVPMYEVDAHNIVPVWEASPKQEFGAYTIRPKIQKMLATYLTKFPELSPQNPSTITRFISMNPPAGGRIQNIHWDEIVQRLTMDRSVKPVTWLTPGETAAHHMLADFIQTKLPQGYAEKRNDPNEDALSHLSPYLHFGQISAQRIAYEMQKAVAPREDKEAFLEELIVRRKLADNYCFYNPYYDSFDGFPDWAKKSLNIHATDVREFMYSRDEFEEGKTHDPIWNACQREMVVTGKMHGYMRMYWAKKILEWTKSPQEAMETAIFLNDKYELDGRDPNGYVGCAWAIGGVHDRAWFERGVFGKIRFMNANGLRRKVKIDAYVKKWEKN